MPVSGLTNEKITIKYLYGTDTIPLDLLSGDLIRPTDKEENTKVDINEYMNSGPGRFATAPQFALVNLFFTDADEASALLAPGFYSEQDLTQYFGDYYQFEFFENISLQQRWYADEQDDLGERAYIWGTTGFDIHDDAVFVIEADGTRHINNFAVVPWYPENKPENFDFESDSELTDRAGQLFVEPAIDPSGIGRKVNIAFEGVREFDDDYTFEEWQEAYQSPWLPDPSLFPEAVSQIYEIMDALFTKGDTPTRFLDGNKPILYGTLGADVFFYSLDTVLSVTGVNLATQRYLASFVKNGISYVSGAGEDVLHGGAKNDNLYGGADNDSFFGNSGNDLFHGGDHGLPVGLADGIDTVDYFDFALTGVVVDLLGGASSDGQGGTDTLISIEVVIGTDFDDTYKASNTTQRIEAGEGVDTVDFSGRTDAVDVDLSTGQGNVELIDVENLIGSQAADQLYGDNEANEIEGGDGADEIDGGGDADTIYGGAGDDWIDGGNDDVQDDLNGGEGADTFIVRENDVISDNVKDLSHIWVGVGGPESG
jgi:hypothetical protein